MIDVSVVIPTRNRREPLRRTLGALARQDYPLDRFEVVVAIDGDADATREALVGQRFPFRLEIVASDEPRGAAAARNLGARAASGGLLVFLDDDIEATSPLLAEHARACSRGVDVSVGYLRTAASAQSDLFQVALRKWWEAMFANMRRTGHRYDFRDVLTGNCAIAADLFRAAGGFDENFRCHEDYEIGVRLLAASARVRFAEKAAGVHHECTTLSRAFVRKRDEGRADIEMLRKHPHVADALPLGVFEAYATRTQSLIRRLVFERPAVATLVAGAFTRSLRPLESLRLRGRWQRRLHDLLHYWYWRGVSDVVPDFMDFQRFRAGCRADATWRPKWLDVDLATGLAAVMHTIDSGRPDALAIHYGAQPVGKVPPMPAAEPLTGLHLKAALARELSGPLVSALGRARIIALERGSKMYAAGGPIPAAPLRL